MEDTLDQLDFSLSCEFCDQPAVCMGKGCADVEHVAACRDCISVIRESFERSDWWITCFVCGLRYGAGFYAHFDVRPI